MPDINRTEGHARESMMDCHLSSLSALRGELAANRERLDKALVRLAGSERERAEDEDEIAAYSPPDGHIDRLSQLITDFAREVEALKRTIAGFDSYI